MKPLKIVIVEDEQKIRRSIANVIRIHYPNATVVGEAENATSGIQVIKESNPDVVLLDIQMPGNSGFDMLKELVPLTFKVIFITAFNEFAVRAFKFSAVDYLLKPVVPDELVEALQKALQQINAERSNEKLDVLMGNLNGLAKENKKIILNSHDKMQVVSVADIIKCKADGNYTIFYLQNKSSITVSKPIKVYEELLAPLGFFRCHNSYLVNLSFVDRLEKRDGGILILKDGSKLDVSSRKNAELMSAISRL
ncbi:MAG: LytR/AlgR family response regulator transcription factor [Bacteroidia bacterium]